jgi:hypothetical protein
MEDNRFNRSAQQVAGQKRRSKGTLHELLEHEYAARFPLALALALALALLALPLICLKFYHFSFNNFIYVLGKMTRWTWIKMTCEWM